MGGGCKSCGKSPAKQNRHSKSKRRGGGGSQRSGYDRSGGSNHSRGSRVNHAVANCCAEEPKPCVQQQQCHQGCDEDTKIVPGKLCFEIPECDHTLDVSVPYTIKIGKPFCGDDTCRDGQYEWCTEECGVVAGRVKFSLGHQKSQDVRVPIRINHNPRCEDGCN